MTHTKIRLALCLSAALLVSVTARAEQTPTQSTAPAKLPTPTRLLSVNGQPLTDMDAMAFAALQGKRAPSDRNGQIKLLNQLINTTILAQRGEMEGLEKLPNIKSAIEMARIQVLAESYVQNFFNRHPVTDAEIEKAYKEKYSGENLNEYQVRHILVKTEDEARKLIAELDKGADFADLAKGHSLDASKENGGLLGWVGRDQVVKPFGDAMVKLKKGEYTKTPVKSNFGWHVIKVDDVRQGKAPPLKEVKAQLAAQLRQKKLAEHLLELRKQAKIEVPKPPAAAK